MHQIVPQLWIGNALEARNVTAVLDIGIEAIVDLAVEESPVSSTRELIYLRVPISDGAGNPAARICLAIATIRNLVSSEIPTLVACSAGMSRSPAIAAAALSQLEGITIEDALAQITAVRPCDVSPGLLSDVLAAAKQTAD